MKKIYTLLAVNLCLLVSATAQEDDKPEDFVAKKVQCSKFYKTPELRELVPHAMAIPEDFYDNWEAKDGRGNYVNPHMEGAEDIGIPENNGIDPAMQSEMGTRVPAEHRDYKANWQGMGGGLPSRSFRSGRN